MGNWEWAKLGELEGNFDPVGCTDRLGEEDGRSEGTAERLGTELGA